MKKPRKFVFFVMLKMKIMFFEKLELIPIKIHKLPSDILSMKQIGLRPSHSLRMGDFFRKAVKIDEE